MKKSKTIKRKFKSLFYKIKKFIYRNFKTNIVRGYYQVDLYSNWEDTTFNSYFFGYYEDDLKNQINKLNNPFIFFDIGANQGLYTLLALKNKNCLKVYSFEPVKKTFSFFKKNINANYSNELINQKCNIFKCAISKFNEKKEIFIPQNSSGKASLSDSRKMEKSSKEIIDTVNNDWLNKTCKIDKNCDIFLKIDVEGYEEIVIRELLITNFSKSIKYIIFEKHDDWDFISYSNIENFLKEEGFNVERLQRNSNKKYDVLCTRR